MVFFVWLSRYDLKWAEFPDTSETPVLKYISGPELTRYINEFTDWFVGGVDTFTIWLKDFITEWLINPLQDLLGQSPWWLMALVLLAVAYVLGGWKPAVITLVCEAVIFWTGLWNDTMVTLAMTLVATVLVMLIAVVLGVSMGRNRRADLGIRPFLDAFQVLPPFVYLVPALALFGVGRFTAIMAAVAYAVPIATKLVADGIRGVSPTTVEAARSTGSTSLADDHQGAAADGPRGAGARRQPGPAVRAGDGRHRRHGRRRQPRLHRGLRLLARTSCSARDSRRASPSPRSGS